MIDTLPNTLAGDVRYGFQGADCELAVNLKCLDTFTGLVNEGQYVVDWWLRLGVGVEGPGNNSVIVIRVLTG